MMRWVTHWAVIQINGDSSIITTTMINVLLGENEAKDLGVITDLKLNFLRLLKSTHQQHGLQ